MKIDELALWEAFQRVATDGNFSRAAKTLRISVPQLSKRVSKLENHLNVRLFTRSTRKVTLTDEGRSLLPRVNSLLEDLNSLESSFENQQDLAGTIRITSVPFVAKQLIPFFSKFMSLYPKIKIDLALSEAMFNLVESNIDLAIRIHDKPTDSHLVYRKLRQNELILCASLQYLKQTTPLVKPVDLQNHSLLILSVHERCHFQDGSFQLKDLVKKKRINCDQGEFLTELALNHFGILLRSSWGISDHLKKRRLVRVLEKYPIEPFGNIYAVVPSRRFLAPRVRALLDFLVHSLAHGTE